VVLHAFTVMSNHWHAVLTDVQGRLPEFAEWLHKYVAKCMNISLCRSENFWSSVHYNAIPLNDGQDVLDKIVYTLANPVTAGLVPRSRDWPGLRSEPGSHLVEPDTIERPRIYFREDGDVPEKAMLKIEKPQVLIDVHDEEYAKIVEAELGKRETEQRRRITREGGSFLGLRRIRSQSPIDTAAAAEQLFRRVPRVAGRDSGRRRVAIKKLRSFVTRYKEAMKKFMSGIIDVVFPAGTYWMRRFLGVACEEPG